MNEKSLLISLKLLFEVNRRNPARHGPTVTLFDDLLLEYVERYELEPFT